ncbi:MAG TPA: porin [Longibacter sp.]|jgi:phosphate-selective porin
MFDSSHRRYGARSLCALLVMLLAPQPSTAQTNAPAQDSARTHSDVQDGPVMAVDGATLRLGGVYQMDFTAQDAEEASGFDVRAARLRTTIVSHGLEAFLQTEFTGAPAVFDARLRYAFSEYVRISAGLFKSPFSRSHLISRPVLPFSERPVAVDAIAPRRQVGMSARVQAPSGWFSLTGGIFNGNGRTVTPNDNQHFLYVGRATLRPKVAGGLLSIAGNIALSIDESVRLGALSPSFSGTRTVYGADASYVRGRWLLAVEGLMAELDPAPGEDQISTGGYVIGGVPLFSESLQLVSRYQRFDPDTGSVGALARVEAGLNYQPSPTVRLQFSGSVPTEELPGEEDGLRATLRLQLALR